MLRQLTIQELQPGMVIVRIVEQNGHVKIKKSGLVTSQDMVQGLLEMGIQLVEVDIDQTVAVEPPKIKKSATQRMLQSSKVTNTAIDDDVSQQFHRSLFLSSAQGIPSAWQFYTKRYVLAALITLSGLGLGWSLANYHRILTLVHSQFDMSVMSVPTPDTTLVTPATPTLENNLGALIKVDKPQDLQPNINANVPGEQTVVADEIETSTEANFELNEVLQTPSSSPEPKLQISADVLARFTKAMNEVEDLPVTPLPVESLSSSEDVPRIDQLPAWVMNRLPSMAFSVHMYASIQSERWVRVNGTKLVEGDKIDGMLEIIRIEPQHVILNYSGQTFSMAALTDW